MNRSILFLAFLIVAISNFMGVPDAYALGHYGIPGTLDGCDVCHDFANGHYDNPTLGNLRWVRSTINSRSVSFTKFSSSLPADGTLADGNDTKLDGPCEVCHTQTNYHTNTDDGTTHFDAQDCTVCHSHFADDLIDYFEPSFVGTQSHITHWTDPKGPLLGEENCTICHHPTNFALFVDGEPLVTTTVCNTCHSPDGAYDGVGDVTVGAKPNWAEGIYESNGSHLKEGKEDWCATCHDDGTSVISSVSAPNVMGDSVTYGYHISGHGRNPLSYVKCEDCHDLTVTHIDSQARTYVASSNNYMDGYRLNEDMAIPRNGQSGQSAFRLCIKCHLYTDIIGPTSNFRDDLKGIQFHAMHLDWWPSILCSDSDWDGFGCSMGICVDSATTCITCHTVHGSPTPAMTRHGELISSPGTANKVPALDFRWYKADGSTQTTLLEESRYGGLLCGLQPDLSFNHVCFGCHQTGELKWYRIPGGPEEVTIQNVWTTDLGNNLKTIFGVGEDIRYHVSFTISGPGSYFVKAIGWARNTSGTYWWTDLRKKTTLSSGTYEWTWDETIPGTASPGSEAKVVMPMKMLDAPGGNLISTDKKKTTFSIAP